MAFIIRANQPCYVEREAYRRRPSETKTDRVPISVHFPSFIDPHLMLSHSLAVWELPKNKFDMPSPFSQNCLTSISGSIVGGGASASQPPVVLMLSST